MTDTVCSLDDLDRDLLLTMMKQFKQFAGTDWNDIVTGKAKGLGWDTVEQSNMNYRIPKSVNRTELNHLKISRKARVWGYRDGDTFNLVWIDPEHKVTPE